MKYDVVSEKNVLTTLILDDFGVNTSESAIVGTDRYEVQSRTQLAFAREFERYGI